MKRLLQIVLVALALPVLAQTAPPPSPPSESRHLKPSTDSGPYQWTGGHYTYDAAGDVIGIDQQYFRYDLNGRLVTASVLSPNQSPNPNYYSTRTYGYDQFGNMTSKAADSGTPTTIAVSAATNRLTGMGAQYDAAGNLTNITYAGTSYFYAYDALGSMNSESINNSAVPTLYHIYTPSAERLWTADNGTSTNTFTVRDLSGSVLRQINNSGSTWTVSRDYAYRNGAMLAANVSSTNTVENYSLDHLGTPRLITATGGSVVGYHVYWPFGEEWFPPAPTAAAQEGNPKKFTGHERDRDLANYAADPFNLDYMHARFYSGSTGRFLSVDPVLHSDRAAHAPQMWNRYAYALDDPLVYTDPTGTTVYIVTYTTGNDEGDEQFRRAAMTRAAQIRGMKSYNPKKDTVLIGGVRTKADFTKLLASAKALGSTYGKVGELDIFSHAGPTDGPTFHHGVAPLEQFSRGDLKSMSVDWEWWGNAKFFGCNTGLNFTQYFADAQGVTAYGFTSFASFSGSPYRWSIPWGSGPLYMVQSKSNYTMGGFSGAAAKWFGLDRETVPMEPADPHTP